MDYTEVENQLNTIINYFELTKNRNHPFKGRNHMSNYVVKIGQFKNGIWFELSYGRWLDNLLYGITFKGNAYAEKLSQCAYSFKYIKHVLNEVSKISNS